MAANAVQFVGRKFRVERVEDGRNGHPHDVIVHPGAAVILPLLDEDRVVLIRNRRIATGHTLLELPAGTLEPPEPPIECARRELQEETGYRAGRLVELLRFYSAPGFCNELLHAFLATELTPGQLALEASEQIETEVQPLADALQAIRDGRIIDAKTIATLLYYDRFGR